MKKYIARYSIVYSKVCVFELDTSKDILSYKKDIINVQEFVMKCFNTKIKALQVWFYNNNNKTKSKDVFYRYTRRFYPEELLWVIW